MRLRAWLGPLLFFASLLAHIHCEDVFGIVGENFTFPVKIDQKITEIMWTKNRDKVAEWEGQTNPTYFTSLHNRGLLNKDYGSLTIFNLENRDAGTYRLDYFDSGKRSYELTFTLAVLDPPSEPEISCNISGDGLLLKCTADFRKPLNYTWKFSSVSITHHTQEVVIPKTIVDASEKASCFIKFSQTEKSSEISLTQCFPDNTGDSYHKRSRYGLIVGFVFSLIVVIAVIVYIRAATKRGTRGAAQMNRPTCVSGEDELLCPEDSQEWSNSDRVTQDAEGGSGEPLSNSASCRTEATSPQAVDHENEKPEADLKEEDGALQDKQTAKNGANQEEVTQDAEGGSGEPLSNSASCRTEATSPQAVDCENEKPEADLKEEDGALQDKQTVKNGANQEEVTQDAEGGSGEPLSNSASCRTEEANNCFVDQTTTEEKQ